MGVEQTRLNVAEKMLDRYGDMILRISYTYMKNIHDAEDILQEVLLIYMTKGREFSSDTHEKAWFIRVTINLCKNKS